MDNQLNQEQLDRLQAFKAANGNKWKAKLLGLWMNGRDASERDGHLLRQVRNKIGPKGLYDLKLD
jgi:hypothetical protein